jgi:hypothetical protein
VKKILFGILAIGFLVGCNSNADSKKEENNTEVTTQDNKKDESPALNEEPQTVEKQEESKYPFPSAATTGEAKLTVSTPSGDSSSGTAPVLFVNPDDILIQIGADLENFQGDKQTFIYVDKIFQTTEQVGELTQTSVDLSENQLEVGVHKVTAIQFENDDPVNGNVINFVEAEYEVKESK